MWTHPSYDSKNLQKVISVEMKKAKNINKSLQNRVRRVTLKKRKSWKYGYSILSEYDSDRNIKEERIMNMMDEHLGGS